MANILCPKCKAEVSSLSLACPVCQASLDPNPVASPRNAGTAPFWGKFWGVMIEPTSTFKWILQGGRQQHVWTLLFLVGFMECLQKVFKDRALIGPVIWMFVLMGVSYLMLWVMAWLFTHVGSWLGGKGTIDDLFEQVVWSNCGHFLVRVCDVLGLLLSFPGWTMLWNIVGFGVAIWTLVVNVITMSVAHRFSILSAIGTLLLSVVIVLIPIGVIIFVIGIILGRPLF